MYTLKLTSYQIEKLRELIDKRYYKLIDELHTLKEIDEQIEDEIYCVDECKEECNQENKYDCPHFQQHQEELEEDEDDCCCKNSCECENKENKTEEIKANLCFAEDWDTPEDKENLRNYNKRNIQEHDVYEESTIGKQWLAHSLFLEIDNEKINNTNIDAKYAEELVNKFIDEIREQGLTKGKIILRNNHTGSEWYNDRGLGCENLLYDIFKLVPQYFEIISLNGDDCVGILKDESKNIEFEVYLSKNKFIGYNKIIITNDSKIMVGFFGGK